MTLKTRLSEDLKDAMKNKEIARRDALRTLQAAVKQIEIDKRIELDDAGVIDVLTAEAKKRRESIEAYESGGRSDKAEAERVELSLIETYLPRQLGRDELKALAQAVISEVGATSVKDISKIMPVLMPKVKGQADGRVVNEVVRELLG